MSTVYLPHIGQGVPNHKARPMLGFGFRTQGVLNSEPTSIPVERALTELDPPCWYNWHWCPKPAWHQPAGSEYHGYYAPGWWPHSWNPPAERLDGKRPDMALTWAERCVAENPGAIWLVGNEPVHAEPPYRAWCPVERMADHCTSFQRQHGTRIAPAGLIATQDADYAYAEELQRMLWRAGTEITAWHWHLYPELPERWDYWLDRVVRWAHPRPVIISETNYWAGTVDDQRRLMDRIVNSLHQYAGVLLAVFWYVSWEAPSPTLPNAWQLLDRNSADCELTATGRHYVEISS